MKKPIKKLVKGKDWDGFAFLKYKTGKFIACYMSNPLPWYPGLETTKTGKWVRVKFIEVKS